jgi:hypothetical protein
MRHFLFAHIHWLWFLLHWLHHDLYARWTFGIFVFIGLAQTIIAWESGELAVKALPQELLTHRLRRRYLRLVRTLAFLLFPATIFVAVVNDRNQRDADDKAIQARTDQQVTQSKLNEADTRAIHAQESFDVFAKSLDPTKFTVAQTAKYIQAQGDAARAVTPAAPGKEDSSGPFSSLTDPELGAKAKEFSLHLYRTSYLLNNTYSENYHRARRYLTSWPPPPPTTTSPDVVVQGFLTADYAYHNFMNKVLQDDIPLAYEYRKELHKRLGSRAKVIELPKVAADEASLNQFLMISASALEVWAEQLAQPN